LIPYRSWNNPLSGLGLFVITLLFGCAPLLRPLPKPPFSQEEAIQLIFDLREQGEEIRSFQAVGKLRLEEGGRQAESNLFALGRRPLKVRLEITHPWGKPLSHIVADEQYISVLSLTDNKFLKGPASAFNTEKLFLFGLGLDSAWMILAGRIPILPHHRAVSLKPGEITLYNLQGEIVEAISFSPDRLLPRCVALPRKGITILLSEFEEGDLGPYPSRMRIEKADQGRSLELRYKSLKLNKPIPEEIFQLSPPPGFEIIPLGCHGSWSLPDS
jgi:hypothetical protein